MELTPEKQIAFIAVLADTCNVTRAAAAIGVSRQALYNRKEIDANFATAWDAAVRLGVEAMKDEVKRRAFDGVLEPVFYQGDECGVVRKYSDTLAMFLIKAHDPTYRDNSRIDLGNADDKPFQMTDTQAAARVAALVAVAKQRKGLQDECSDLL